MKKNCYFFFDNLRASRHQGRDRHSNLVGIPILSCPPPIAHIINKKEKKKLYIQELGGHRPNPCVHTKARRIIINTNFYLILKDKLEVLNGRGEWIKEQHCIIL
jgi:hypothetical protein